MKRPPLAYAVITLALLGATLYGGYRWGMERGMQMAAPQAASTPAPRERRVLYWVDPMVPGPKFDKPGKSPFMDMQLVPVYEDEAADAGAVTVSAGAQQNLGMRTAEAVKAPLAKSLEVAGTVAFDERELALVQARANGYVEHLYVRAPLERVKRGAPLAQVLVPDWVAAQEDFLAARRMTEGAHGDLVDAARQRMRLAGMSDAQVRAIESSGTVQARTTLVAPVSGVVTELAAREGMTIASGAPLFRINGLSTVWVNAEIPESATALVKPGAAITATAAAFPGRRFEGRIGAVLPEVNAATRTLRARIELANPGEKLAPGMFVTVRLSADARGDVLQVPSEAIIATGRRNLVIVADTGKDGKTRLRPIEVQTGEEAQGRTEIRHGLEPGTRVVVSGQFLIDSEASLKGLESRFDAVAPDDAPKLPPATPAPSLAPGAHEHAHHEDAKASRP